MMRVHFIVKRCVYSGNGIPNLSSYPLTLRTQGWVLKRNSWTGSEIEWHLLPSKRCYPTRGLRQENPLSLFFFTIILKHLSQSMKVKTKRGEHKTYKLGGSKVESYLVYKSKKLSFCKTKIKSRILIAWLLTVRENPVLVDGILISKTSKFKNTFKHGERKQQNNGKLEIIGA